MLDHRSLRFRALLIAALAGLTLAACGDDDGSDATAGQPNEPAAEATSGGAPEGSSGSSGSDSNGSSPNGTSGSSDGSDNERGSATATIDGVTYTFEPKVCIAQGPEENAVSGAGAADDGTPVYVDLAAGNLAVYLGTDDPFSGDADLVANNFGQGEVQETVSGSTVSVQASFTESGGIEVVAEGSLEATC